MNIIISSFYITAILSILFFSNALPEYLKLFRINKIKIFNFLLLNDYSSQRKSAPLTVDNYWIYLGDKYYGYFLVRLVTCPICLSLWLAILASLIIHQFIFAPVIYILTLIEFFAIKYLAKIE